MGNTRRRKIWKGFALSLLALALPLLDAVPSEAGRNRHGHHHGHRFHGPRHHFHAHRHHFHGHRHHFHGHGRAVITFGPSFYWGYPYWYPPPYYVYTPPPVVTEEPAPAYAQTTPAPPAPPQAFWYYCASAEGYYPTVSSCPEPWVKVPPRAE